MHRGSRLPDRAIHAFPTVPAFHQPLKSPEQSFDASLYARPNERDEMILPMLSVHC